MSGTAPPQQERLTGGSDPWSRWGWVMGVIWLVFLGFPLSEASAVENVAMRATTIAAILAFGAIYLVGMRKVFADPTALSRRARTALLVALIVLTGLTAIVIRQEALGMTPFIIAWVMFTERLRFALAVAGTVLLAAIVMPLAAGQPGAALMFFGISALVTIATVVPRVLGERDAEYQDVSRQLALIAERERVARDVHDVIGHSLTVVSLKSELAERLLDTGEPGAVQQAKAEIREIRSLTRQALAEVRVTVAGMRVARLDEELESARRALSGGGVVLAVTGEVAEVDPRHRIVLSWVVREAVTNIVRHASARRVVIELHQEGVTVSDDGIGIEAGAVGSVGDGNGLRGLRERVEAAGGRLEIGPGLSGRGTSVEASW